MPECRHVGTKGQRDEGCRTRIARWRGGRQKRCGVSRGLAGSRVGSLVRGKQRRSDEATEGETNRRGAEDAEAGRGGRGQIDAGFRGVSLARPRVRWLLGEATQRPATAGELRDEATKGGPMR